MCLIWINCQNVANSSVIPIPILVSPAGPQRHRYWYHYLDLSDTDTDTWYQKPMYLFNNTNTDSIAHPWNKKLIYNLAPILN